MKVLIVPDKFKGTLTAAEAARAIAAGWSRMRPGDELSLLPMSDGGDGFGEIISSLLSAEPMTSATVDAAHRPITAPWWWHDASRTAIVESARVIGLAQLPRGKYHPFDLDTRGLGVVLQAATRHGAQRCIVGIGGSATNDAGFGLARELGWRFQAKQGVELTQWIGLESLVAVTGPEDHLRCQGGMPGRRAYRISEIIVAVDVQNPLLGSEGCTRVYGPQKGLRPEDFPVAERSLERLAAVLREQHGMDFANAPGAGAAGGLGFGLCSFAGAQLASGFDLFAEHARLRERLAQSDLVITAEGAIDRQTIMGKGVGQIATLCAQHKLPCMAFAGVVQEREAAAKQFQRVYALTDLTSPERAMTDASLWLERAATRAAKEFDLQPRA
jgi:glycerate 2-kinase